MGFPPFRNEFLNATHHAEKSRVFDQQMQTTSVAMGTLDEDQVSGILARALSRIKAGRGNNDHKNRRYRDIVQQALLDHINDLNRDIANMEAAFHAAFGDAWREQLALRIFDENDIPRQNAGESIEDYRKRLERDLMENLLNDSGSIKAQYQNDPDLHQYAQWAQKIHNRDAAQMIASGLSNSGVTHAQTQEILDKLETAANAEQNIYTARALEGHEAQKEAVLERSDSSFDSDTLEKRSNNAAINFLNPAS